MDRLQFGLFDWVEASATLSPAEAVVFSAVGDRSGCAATSLCTTIARKLRRAGFTAVVDDWNDGW